MNKRSITPSGSSFASSFDEDEADIWHRTAQKVVAKTKEPKLREQPEYANLN
jgi:hypothetical protein